MLTLGAPLEPNTTYTLTVSGVADLAGNVLLNGQATVFFGQTAVPAPRDLVVNELLYNEPSGGSPGEYVELFNRTDEAFDLSEFTLADATGLVPRDLVSVIVTAHNGKHLTVRADPASVRN